MEVTTARNGIKLCANTRLGSCHVVPEAFTSLRSMLSDPKIKASTVKIRLSLNRWPRYARALVRSKQALFCMSLASVEISPYYFKLSAAGDDGKHLSVNVQAYRQQAGNGRSFHLDYKVSDSDRDRTSALFAHTAKIVPTIRSPLTIL
jgi:hypothetical protein